MQIEIFVSHFFHFLILDKNNLKLCVIYNKVYSSWTCINTFLIT